MAGTSFNMFWFHFIPEMFSALSADFMLSSGLLFDLRSFGCPLFYRLFGFRKFITANFNGTMAVLACVIIVCSFLCRCLQKVTKQQREIATLHM